MLDEKDLQLIGVELGKVLEHNIMPQLDMIHEDIKGIKTEITEMKGEIGGIKSDIIGIKSSMVTKSYLDDKLADLKSDLIGYDRRLEHKTDALIGTLADHRTLTPSDLERLEQARVFPRMTS